MDYRTVFCDTRVCITAGKAIPVAGGVAEGRGKRLPSGNSGATGVHAGAGTIPHQANGKSFTIGELVWSWPAMFARAHLSAL